MVCTLELGFNQNDMALMLGVSKRTTENRLAEFNLTRIERFSDMDDGTLDTYIEHIITYFPRSGKKRYITHSAVYCYVYCIAI